MSIGQILRIVWRGFGKLAVFSGRDARSQFWPYAIFLVLGSMVIWAVTMGIIVSQLPFFEPAAMYRLSDDEVTQVAVQTYYRSLYGVSILTGIVTALAAAAIVRRLHDRNLSGLWGLPPLALLAATLFLMSQFVDVFLDDTASLALVPMLMIADMGYLVSLVLLVIQLAQRGTPGPNRYGGDPLALAQQP